MAKPSDLEIDGRFFYHPPTPAARAAHDVVSTETCKLAKILRDTVPESRGLSLALTALEEVRMWANQGVATNHDKL